VIVELELLKLIPAPVTRLILELDPFSEKFVAAGTFGPEIVIACKDWDNVILFPPTKVTEPEVILLVAPAVLPDVLTTIALCIVGPPIESTLAPLDDTVMLLPPDTVIGPLESDPEGPIEETTEPVDEMVIVELDELKPMPVPATNETLDDDPFREKFVAARTFGPTRVMT